MSPRFGLRLLVSLVIILLAGCSLARSGGDRAPIGPSTTSAPPPTVAPDNAARRSPTPEALRAAVTMDGIRSHLAALQAVADRHGGNRAAGTPGYDASVDYVVGQLQAAGYRPQVQRFQAGRFQERSRPVLELAGVTPEADRDYRTVEFSGSGDVIGPLRRVDLRLPPGPRADGSTSGCEPAD